MLLRLLLPILLPVRLHGGGYGYRKGSTTSIEAAEQFSERRMMSGEVRGSCGDGDFVKMRTRRETPMGCEGDICPM